MRRVISEADDLGTVFAHGPTVSRDDRLIYNLTQQNLKLLSHIQKLLLRDFLVN
jgi:hypothetical protein